MCMYVVFCKIDHCIHIHWCIVMGLGHNDPWVESHMWPQHTWGQRSSRGQWPLVQVFGKKGQCIHILWCIFKSNITMIAKVCDRESRRDTWFENRLVSHSAHRICYIWGEKKIKNVLQYIARNSKLLSSFNSLRCLKMDVLSDAFLESPILKMYGVYKRRLCTHSLFRTTPGSWNVDLSLKSEFGGALICERATKHVAKTTYNKIYKDREGTFIVNSIAYEKIWKKKDDEWHNYKWYLSYTWADELTCYILCRGYARSPTVDSIIKMFTNLNVILFWVFQPFPYY